MATEQEIKNANPLHKEFQNLLDQDFKDRKLKENEIILATVTEITKNFIVVDCKAKMEGMIPIEEFKNDDELKELKAWNTSRYPRPPIGVQAVQDQHGFATLKKLQYISERAWVRQKFTQT